MYEIEPGYDRPLIGLGIALALGLLVGLQREWAEDKPIGLRSFALVTLLGGMSMLLGGPAAIWALAAGLLALGFLLAARTHVSEKGGITTFLAGLVMYMTGAAAVAGYWLHAIVIAGAVTVLLHWKQEMHGWVQRLSGDDLSTIARFVLITFVILPILPDRTFGPYDVFNPFNTWLLVVLIVGINLAGYLALRLVGKGAGAWLAGVVGGLVSSTATTFSYSQMSREGKDLGAMATLVILVASIVIYARIGVEVAVVAPALLKSLAWPSLAFAGVLLLLSGFVYVKIRKRPGADIPESRNPARLQIALVFAGFYAVVLFTVAAARDFLGENALYAVAMVSGLTNVDALTLSVSRLYGQTELGADTAWRVIFLASIANLIFKTGVAAVIGSPSLRRWILATGVPAIAVGLAIVVGWP
jgi:uncharacterized membrane protein (DUF4010 family)